MVKSTAVHLVLFCIALSGAISPGPAKPNIVWIVGDDIGFSDLGFQNSAILTPVIDKLARTGNVLSNFYVQSQCSPTRASFMTGRYPIHTGVVDSLHMSYARAMDLQETTVAQLLLSRGYSTHAIGKWHLGSLSHYHTPTFRGFQSFYGYYGGGEHYTSHAKGKGIDFRRDEGLRCGWHCSRVPVEDMGGYSTELFTDEAVRLIEDHDFDSSPLFMYLAYQAAHFPGEAPQKYFARYARHKHMESSRLLFATIVSAMDEGIGKVLQAIDFRGVTNNTLVIFTTDNGGGLFNGGSNAPLRGGKGEIWEGGTRGVAVIRGPGLSGGGRPLGCRMHAVDWLPTLLSLSGVPVKPDETLPLDGIDVWPSLINGDEPGLRNELFYGTGDERNAEPDGKASAEAHLQLRQTAAATATGKKVVSTALRVGNMKLVVRDSKNETSAGSTAMVFDLEADPFEATDLAAKLPDEVGLLTARLQEIQNSAASPDRGFVAGCPHPMKLVPVMLITGDDGLAWEPFCDAALNSTAISEQERDEPLYARGKELQERLRHKLYRSVYSRAVDMFRMGPTGGIQ